MELSNEQVQKIAAAVIRQRGAVPLVSAGAEAFPGGAGWRQQPPMVQLSPEFYRSRREIAEQIARHDERFVQIDKRFAALQWTIGLGFTFITVLMSAYNYRWIAFEAGFRLYFNHEARPVPNGREGAYE